MASSVEEIRTKKKGGKKKLIVLVVVLAVGGFGARTFLLGGGEKAKAEPEPVKEGEVVEVDPMTVNLADPGRHYARIGLALVLAEGGGGHGGGGDVEKRLALLKDAAITKIGSKTSAMLKTVDGQNELRKELSEVAHELYHGAVLRVILTEIIVE